MMKLRSKRLSRSFSRLRSCRTGGGSSSDNDSSLSGGCDKGCVVGDIKWELRPGGMLVQKRERTGENVQEEGIIVVRVATGSQWHHISIQATSTFGELKMILSMVTSLEPKEQRLLFKGKEREDGEYLHMVGVRNNDKVLLLEDPAIKEMKLLGLARANAIGGAPFRTISV